MRDNFEVYTGVSGFRFLAHSSSREVYVSTPNSYAYYIWYSNRSLVVSIRLRASRERARGRPLYRPFCALSDSNPSKPSGRSPSPAFLSPTISRNLPFFSLLPAIARTLISSPPAPLNRFRLGKPSTNWALGCPLRPALQALLPREKWIFVEKPAPWWVFHCGSNLGHSWVEEKSRLYVCRAPFLDWFSDYSSLGP